MKVLHAPMNFAMQPMLIVEELKKKGVDAKHVQYLARQHDLNFRMDTVYKPQDTNILAMQLKALNDSLDEGFDIYHFWQRSFVFRHDGTGLTGLDLPILKAHQKRILHRFTGFDLRMPKEDMEVNPYSPFRYGYKYPFNEKRQREYIDFLRNYVDEFIVQDPELQQFMPEAKLIPRALDLKDWAFVGIKKTDCPLIVHAPTNMGCKGTPFIMKAIEQLQSENIKFDFKLISNMSHDEAREWYKKADIIVDQILIGATGVLTLEGWALGKPVVIYLREDLFKPFYGDIPAANANPDNITDVLRGLIKDFDLRQELSLKGRKAVEQFHNIEHITDQCLDLYKAVLKQPIKIPESSSNQYILNRYNEFTPMHEGIFRFKTLLKQKLPTPLIRILKAIIFQKSLTATLHAIKQVFR